MDLQKTAHKLGLTYTEFRVISILLACFAAGLIIKYFSLNKDVYVRYENPPAVNIPSINDSLLYFRAETKLPEYKKEILNSAGKKFKKKGLPAEKSININKAGLKELMQLPGIGEKTAMNILALREKKGYFNRPEDLMKVKGIGQKKFNKIIKYIFVE